MNGNILRLALRRAKESAVKEPDSALHSNPSVSELEQAMEDFQSAGTNSERAAAFRAAIELAR